ncbi:hypothetical protein [Thermococcus barossii]|uniref:Uncharacterized protein n=1 Tax=Thermococcus barossii TaxID=54077 RepID=A0A2Z2MJU3_9EURY|nr:hypothetical protein [Thermococcus barossii]ASJ05022.1 hypothetical protein A3L01_06450 [Thermococcus barossii]
MRRVAPLIIAVLLVVTAYTGYWYHQREAELGATMNGLLEVSDMAIFCLEDSDSLGILLKSNVSDDVLRERLSRYTYCSLMLRKASLSIYLANNEERYRNLSLAAADLEVYFHATMNSRNPRKLLSENMETIDEISKELGAILQGGGTKNLSDERVGRLFNLTENLSG